MKIKFEVEVSVSNEFTLDVVNEYQVDNDFEEFDNLDDCPIELIYLIFDHYGIFKDKFYDADFYYVTNSTLEF